MFLAWRTNWSKRYLWVRPPPPKKKLSFATIHFSFRDTQRDRGALIVYIYKNNIRVYIYIYIYTYIRARARVCVCGCGIFNNTVDSSHLYKNHIRQILTPTNLSYSTNRRQLYSNWFSHIQRPSWTDFRKNCSNIVLNSGSTEKCSERRGCFQGDSQ